MGWKLGLAILTAVVSAACGGGGTRGGHGGNGGSASQAGDGGAEEIPEVDESALPEPSAEAGFVEIEPTSYEAVLELAGTLSSERTRLFYSFIPADENAKQKPLFVFFNGGPGSTSMFLFSCGTGRYSIEPDDLAALPKPNSHSFTRLGNLLYIDSRHAGFSYGVSEHPAIDAERAGAFELGSFNAAVDGADFVRVLLRVLAKIPAIRNNPVVIVGESYGGTRASVMLDILLDPASDEVSYRDTSLVALLEEHYAAVFPGIARERITRAARARQFGWQVLIQPLVVGSAQYDAQRELWPEALDRLTRELGISAAEIESERCGHDASRPRAWCEDLDAAVGRTVTTPATFEQLAGVAPELVPGLRAAERGGAFRFRSPAGDGVDPSEMTSLLGTLPAWDRYFNPIVGEPISHGFERVFHSPSYVVPFLRAARTVNTMITNGLLDGAIVSESIVPALNAIVPLFVGERWFTGAAYADPEADPPTQIR